MKRESENIYTGWVFICDTEGNKVATRKVDLEFSQKCSFTLLGMEFFKDEYSHRE